MAKTAAGCYKVREDVARLIYLYLGRHEIVSAFYCEENKSPTASQQTLLLKIQWVAYKCATCNECLSIKSLFAPKFLVYQGKINGSETVLKPLI